jgi:hypothetical protein
MSHLLLSLFAVCCSGLAQAVSVPVDVSSVQTIGRWQSGSDEGSYRIVVTSEGWEHVWSRVFVEWLAEPTNRDVPREPPRVVELMPPLAHGTAVLEASARSPKLGELIITVTATSNRQLGSRKQRFVFRAGAPGEVQLLEALKSR